MFSNENNFKFKNNDKNNFQKFKNKDGTNHNTKQTDKQKSKGKM